MLYLYSLDSPLPPLSVCVQYVKCTSSKFSVTFSVSRSSPPEPPVLTERDQDLGHLDDDVLERGLARLAYHQGRFRQVLAVRAGQLQVRRPGVEVLREAQVLHAALASSATATHVERSRIRQAPAPGQHVDLALVLRVLRFTLDPFDLDEHVNSHRNSPCSCRRVTPVSSLDRWPSGHAGRHRIRKCQPFFSEGSRETRLSVTFTPSSW